MVETSPLPKGTKRYDPSVVKNFLSTALIRVGVEPDDADHSFGFDFTIIIVNNVKMFGYYEQITFVIDYLCVMKIHDLHAY